MSKRFGRNQRRRMREELTRVSIERNVAVAGSNNLSVALAMDRGLLQRQRSKLEEANDFIATVASIVGEYSILCNELTRYDLNLPEREDSFRLVQRPSLPSFEDFKLSLDRGMSATLQVETMRLLKVQAVRQRLSGAMHCVASLAGGLSHYAISYSALKSLSTSMLNRLVIPQLAEALIKDIKKGHRG